MKAQITLEWIGAEESMRLSKTVLWGGPPLRKPWVAELVGKFPSGKPKRSFLIGGVNYAKSNQCGSRGVSVSFILETNKLYQVHNNVSWRNSTDWFCAVTENGDIKEINISEATEWLNEL